ncbi:MAG: SLC13 family permease, partial [Polyangiaceae bacterium]
VDRMGNAIAALLRTHRRLGWVAILVGVAVTSGFINNTAVVAVLIPILIRCGKDVKMSPSRLLIPVSFASMLGGVCTLMGTSTNLIVSSIAADHGHAPLGFFEMLPVGVVFLVVGLAYLLVVRRFIPERREEQDLTRSFSMGRFLTRATLLPNAPSVGRRLADSPLARDLDLEVVGVSRDGHPLQLSDELILEEGDALRVRGPREAIVAMEVREGLSLGLRDLSDVDVEDTDMMLVEAVVTPRSAIAGQALGEAQLWDRFSARALALRQRGEVEHEALGRRALVEGDVLLLLLPRARRRALERASDLVVISGEPLKPPHSERLPVALAIVVAVVLLAATEVLPVVVGAPIGAVVMVLAGCIDLDDAYQAIDWDVVVLLAGMLALGVAFGATGADGLLSGLIVALGAHGGVALVGATYLLTLVLTSTMSNQATAALLTPIALSAAATLGVSPRPLVIAVAFAASSSFLTPVGYQTNTMVYGAGHYRFGDFVRLGGPLSVVLAVLGAVLIPWVWPL